MTDPQTEPELTQDERLVFETLKDEPGGLDAISISSRTRIPVERTLGALNALVEHGLVKRVQPEPVHERFTPSPPLQPA